MVGPDMIDAPPDPQPPSRAGSLSLLGGRLCLDFTNTSSGRRTPDWLEHLRDYGHLLAWGVHTGILDADTKTRLETAAAADPAGAAAVLRRAVTLREALYRTIPALAAGAEPAAEDMAVINGEFRRAASQALLQPRGAGCVVGWAVDGADLDRVLWPIVWSAAELMQAPDEVSRVKSCGSCDCGWLFLDASKNRTRRWCTMSHCGNRAKARRHYQRQKHPVPPDAASF